MSITYAEACRDPHLFGDWFHGPSWAAWRVLDKAIFGEPLDAAELVTFRELTGRDEAPTEPATEAWIVAGRRSGKDLKAASIAVYLATVGAEQLGYLRRLVRGERGVVQVLAVDRDQAKVCLGYVRGFLSQPMLARLVARDTADGIELKNGLAIEITTNDKRRVRGRTVVAAVLDEVAFWTADGGANPDTDVYAAIKPAMATVPGAMLIGISSPYARRGLLWTKYKSHYGAPGRTLVVQAPTWTLNPTLPRDGEFLTGAFTDDPASAAAEYGAQFRSDIEAFVAREVVEVAIDRGVYERAPIEGISYIAFVDPSGGSADSMTLAVAHREGERAILDCVREVKPPFSPESVVAEFCADLKRYRLATARSDRYGAEWVRTAFARHGVDLKPAERPKSDLYGDMLAPLNSGLVSLLDNDRLVNQLCTLERRTARGGKDSIDHAPGAHDDVANAVAGVISFTMREPAAPFAFYIDGGTMIDSAGTVLAEGQPYRGEPVRRISTPWMRIG